MIGPLCLSQVPLQFREEYLQNLLFFDLGNQIWGENEDEVAEYSIDVRMYPLDGVALFI